MQFHSCSVSFGSFGKLFAVHAGCQVWQSLRQTEVFKTNPLQQVLMLKFLGDYKIKKPGYFVLEYCIMFNARWKWVPSIVQNTQPFTGNGEDCIFQNSRGSKTSENQNTSTMLIYLFTLIVIVHCFCLNDVLCVCI